MTIQVSSRPSTAALAITFLSLAFIGTPSHASASAARPKGASAESFIDRALRASKSLSSRGVTSVVSRKTQVDLADWKRLPLLPSNELQISFTSIRDERPFRDEESRARRATWLYPDDGCFVRAVIADRILREKFAINQSAKIFAFGNLRVQTKNSPSGEVQWWYHVAAIVKVQTKNGEEAFVFDPAMDPTQPIHVQEWLDSMSDSNLEIAICSGAAYDPSSACDARNGDLANSEGRAHREANWFLPSEWDRVVELGRDPQQELMR